MGTALRWFGLHQRPGQLREVEEQLIDDPLDATYALLVTTPGWQAGEEDDSDATVR